MHHIPGFGIIFTMVAAGGLCFFLRDKGEKNSLLTNDSNPIPLEGIENNGFVYRYVTEVHNDNYVRLCPCGEELKRQTHGYRCDNGHWCC